MITMSAMNIIAASLLAAALSTGGRTITYSLPQTVIEVEVSTVREEWHAGLYSAYAKELLGIESVLRDSTAYSISGVTIKARTEADQSARYRFELTEGAQPVYLSMTEHGLLAGTSDAISIEAGQSQALAKPEAPELGRLNWVSGKLEAEAKAAAKQIAELREARYNILTGNTDATYSGDALRAAVEELRRMEEEILLCFTGTYTTTTESASFEVVPQVDETHQAMVYEAFCLHPTKGIEGPGSVEGIPYYLEIDCEAVARPEEPQCEEVPEDGKRKKAEPARPSQYITYRIPAMCRVRLTDGERTLTGLRLAIYQLGIEEQYPIYN